ncbi:MAG: cbb3-type cytochrome oxidase assembly protein CcoS [Marinilabiliaceae bacterium]|nr:cbb3-type cytochrome oxidase assembly protein CcoS [Marinilabiliaceae bacterium]
MEIIFVLIVISLIVALIFLFAFIWAVRSGQYEDDYSPSVRILFDDEPHTNNQKEKSNPKSTPSNEARDVLLRQ